MDITKKLWQNIINQRFFKDKDQLFLVECILVMKLLYYKRGQIIYLENRYPYNIYFIHSGRINCINKFKMCFTSYVTNSYFGDIEMIKNIE